MICPECQTCWCYFCGLKESDCDKGDQSGFIFEATVSIYHHNANWINNPKRFVYLKKKNFIK